MVCVFECVYVFASTPYLALPALVQRINQAEVLLGPAPAALLAALRILGQQLAGILSQLLHVPGVWGGGGGGGHTCVHNRGTRHG